MGSKVGEIRIFKSEERVELVPSSLKTGSIIELQFSDIRQVVQALNKLGVFFEKDSVIHSKYRC